MKEQGYQLSVALACVFCLIIASCGIGPADVDATIAAIPTDTPLPTTTSAPTQTAWIVIVTQTRTPTPIHTATMTLTPSETLTPSITPNRTETRQAVIEATNEAVLTAPRGDGFYLVGIDIATGTWRSEAGYSGCYWSLNDAQGNINDNHFGDSGGVVHIGNSDYEVQFDDCGTWTYLGP